jgi:hypothetical protein
VDRICTCTKYNYRVLQLNFGPANAPSTGLPARSRPSPAITKGSYCGVLYGVLHHKLRGFVHLLTTRCKPVLSRITSGYLGLDIDVFLLLLSVRSNFTLHVRCGIQYIPGIHGRLLSGLISVCYCCWNRNKHRDAAFVDLHSRLLHTTNSYVYHPLASQAYKKLPQYMYGIERTRIEAILLWKPPHFSTLLQAHPQ